MDYLYLHLQYRWTTDWEKKHSGYEVAMHLCGSVEFLTVSPQLDLWLVQWSCLTLDKSRDEVPGYYVETRI